MEVKRMEESLVRILQILDRAGSGCPLGYITRHTNIIAPLPVLETLEKDGCVSRVKSNTWSPTGQPLFEMTEKGRTMLRQVEASALQVSLKLVEETLTSE
jgi:hypothetical protein